MTTILRGIVGSTAYGLATEDSDVDRLGCYVVPTVEFHGLHKPKESRVQTSPSDYTEHEVGKYVSLLLKCNPTVMELLWLPEDLYETVLPEGVALVEMRELFLSAKAVRNAYLGYATQQFKKLCDRGDGSFSADTRKRTEKHARHLRRLCWQGLELYATGQLPIQVEQPEEYHQFGKQVAEDPASALELIRHYEMLFNDTETVLPDKPDKEGAETWLRLVRKFHYHECAYGRMAPEDRTTRYMTELLGLGLVRYRSLSTCRAAFNNLLTTFERVEGPVARGTVDVRA